MSQFDDFNSVCLGDAGNVFGRVTFTMGGELYEGILNEHQASGESGVEGYGANIDATLMIDIALLAGLDAPLEKTLTRIGTISASGRAYKVESVQVDTLTATLLLSTPSSGRSS